MSNDEKSKFLTIKDIQREYINLDSRVIRQFVKKNIPYRYFNSLIIVERDDLDDFFSRKNIQIRT